MRCFIAIDVPEKLKEPIKKLQDEIRGYGVKLVDPENLHFTLKFLGDAESPEEVSKRLEQVKLKPFEVELKSIGCFPSIKSIRVVWIGVEHYMEFINLQKSVEDVLYPEYPKEDFVPHLTIARAGSRKLADEISKFIGKNEEVRIGKMKIDSFKLKESVLTPRDPVYRDIETFGRPYSETSK